MSQDHPTSKKITPEHEQALKWARTQNYPSVAARYAKLCAEAYDMAAALSGDSSAPHDALRTDDDPLKPPVEGPSQVETPKPSKEESYRNALAEIRQQTRSDPADLETAMGSLRSIYDITNMALFAGGAGFTSPVETTTNPQIDAVGLDELLVFLDPGICECRECPECGRMPSECTGTECAKTCQCSECGHCRIQFARAELKKLPSAVETGPKPDADKAPVTSAELCPTWDRVQHKEHNGKCVYCGAPMPSEKASEQECRSAGPSGNAAGTGPVDPGAEARSSRREVTAQKASAERCRSGHLYEGSLVQCCKDENHSGRHYNLTVDYHWGSENGETDGA